MNSTTRELGTTKLRIPGEVKALLSAFHLTQPDTTLLEKLSDEEWTRLLAFCDLAQLTLPLAQVSMRGIPQWVAERLKINMADNALRFERVKATYREVARAFTLAGVEHIVVKGFTQAPDYVADPRLRPQSDIDIFCPAECIDAASHACEAIGYRRSEVAISYARADHPAALVRPGDFRWRGRLYDPEMPLSIELHFCLWNERISHIPVAGAELLWARRTTREVDGVSFSCLSPVDHLTYFALHILRNVLLSDWIVHHVRELAAFLHNRAGDDVFWMSWEEAHAPSLRSLAAIAFYYAREWFGCRLHPVAMQAIDRLPAASASWLKYFSGSALELMFQTNKDSVWLHMSLVSTRAEKWKVLKGAFIPDRIGPIGYVPLQVRNRRVVQAGGKRPWQQYISYMTTRSISYGSTNMATLGRGLRWRLSEHSLIPKLWPAES